MCVCEFVQQRVLRERACCVSVRASVQELEHVVRPSESALANKCVKEFDVRRRRRAAAASASVVAAAAHPCAQQRNTGRRLRQRDVR